MNEFWKRSGVACLLALTASACGQAALAADAWPNRSVYIVVPFGAGGVADALPRLVAQKLSEKWGVSVIVENKPGASGNIGMAFGAHAQADGYTLVLAPAGNLTVNPVLFPKLNFDTAKDLIPITELGESPNVLVVNPKVPAANFKELVDYARANPDKINFSSPGAGSGAHLAGELLNQRAGIRMQHIPYNAMALAVNDVIGGTVDMIFAASSQVIQQVNTGKLRALAIAGPHRIAQLPDVPTVAESGYAGFDVTSWYGLVAPKGVPPAIVDKIQADIAAVLKQDDVRAKFAVLGVDPVGNTPQEFAAVIVSESRKWNDIVRAANIQPLQ